MKKYISQFFAELLGTFILVFIGCGTAMSVGASLGPDEPAGYVCVAFAFGLGLLAAAYSVGNISGGHFNPAVSLGLFINGHISAIQLPIYIIGQIIGGIAAACTLVFTFDGFSASDLSYSYAQTLPSEDIFNPLAFIMVIETITTCIFVMTVCGVSSKKQRHGALGGLIVALTLVGIHAFSIRLTGTSVNPARSIGPAVAAAMADMTEGLPYLWPYIVAPMLGGAIGGVLYRLLEGWKQEKTEE